MNIVAGDRPIPILIKHVRQGGGNRTRGRLPYHDSKISGTSDQMEGGGAITAEWDKKPRKTINKNFGVGPMVGRCWPVVARISSMRGDDASHFTSWGFLANILPSH